jgi:outer membrane biosynthesis protein TonB
MQRSYLVKSPVHFADFGFFVKVGDILVHDTANANRLTVYRNGEVVRAVNQTPLGIAAMVKNKFIEEVIQAPTAKPVSKPVAAPPKPVPAPKPASAPKPSPQIVVKKEEKPVKKEGKSEPETKKQVKAAARLLDELEDTTI